MVRRVQPRVRLLLQEAELVSASPRLTAHPGFPTAASWDSVMEAGRLRDY